MPKILIVEDEEYLSDMYKLKFEQAGYKVSIARDGAQGLALAKKELPDLVLLDLVLPGFNGYQVLAELRKDAATKNLKVYILSNLGQSDEVDKGIKGGADGYFIKAKLTPSQLLDKVNEIFNKPALVNGGTPQSVDNKKIEPTAVKGKGIKILLIEDEEAIINMYKLRFAKEGYELEAARNGAWGLKLAKQKKFDLILLDMVMPAMNGYEAIKILKADERTRNLPIIILSNSAQDKDIAEAKKLGAAAYLLKSAITPAKLIKEVEKILINKK